MKEKRGRKNYPLEFGLAVFMDLFWRRIVGRDIDKWMTQALVS